MSHTWFIYNLNTILYYHDIHTIGMICTRLALYRRYMHNPLDNPPCLENPSPVPEPHLLTWNPSFASWCNSCPLWSLVACVLTSSPPFPPHPLLPLPNGSPFQTCARLRWHYDIGFTLSDTIVLLLLYNISNKLVLRCKLENTCGQHRWFWAAKLSIFLLTGILSTILDHVDQFISLR